MLAISRNQHADEHDKVTLGMLDNGEMSTLSKKHAEGWQQGRSMLKRTMHVIWKQPFFNSIIALNQQSRIVRTNDSMLGLAVAASRLLPLQVLVIDTEKADHDGAMSQQMAVVWVIGLQTELGGSSHTCLYASASTRLRLPKKHSTILTRYIMLCTICMDWLQQDNAWSDQK